MKEDGYELLVDKMSLASRRLLSIVGYVEACMVLTRLRGESAGRELDWLLSESRVEIFPVDNSQGKLARDAFLRFGKGRHSAKLNFGDCFSYALAKQLGQPLLYVGNDFSQTDIVSA